MLGPREKGGTFDLEIDDQWSGGGRDHALDHGLDVLAEPADHLGAPTGTGGRAGERPVDAGADPDGVHTAAARKLVADRGDDFLLEADESVGNQDHLALRVTSDRAQGLEDARAHLGAAAGPQGVEPLVGGAAGSWRWP